uniref:Adiponectin receptor protein n=1 Tax=Steinernema glaseri TaxID=37863 RepID=A0A1I7YG50_9BILA
MLRLPEDDETGKFLPANEQVSEEDESEKTVKPEEIDIEAGLPLAEEQTVESSPVQRQPQPIEIVVRNINQVVGQPDSSDDDYSEAEADAVREVNHYLQREGFTVTEKQNGADCEIVTSMNNGHGLSSTTFKKGHRRAWSMPSGHKDRRILAVVDDDEENINPNQRRHIVRYRLHPYKPKKGVHDLPEFDEAALPPAEEDDCELEVDINEAEIMCFPGLISARKGTRTIVRKLYEAKWKAQNFEFLPEWLQDNEFLRTGHRPPLPSFFSCFNSIFTVHTETGNIWTHMYGCIAFMGVTLWFLTRSSTVINWLDKVIFSTFFAGAIICLGCSFVFHTVQCHSIAVGKLFSKLDYTGISLLIVGSFIPWIYYGFYCRRLPMLIYMAMITILGIAAMIVSLWDKFSEPKFRPLRAIVFVAMGLSSIIPALHFYITDGFNILFEQGALHWLLAMGAMYLIGAALYAFRIPERCFPGKCDILFQSHQLFHTCVIIAAFVHFHGITEMAMIRLEQGSCAEQMADRYGDNHKPSFVDEWLEGTY